MTIDGASIAILVDMGPGRVPFILDRDKLDDPLSTLAPQESGGVDITAKVITVDQTWGSSEWLGDLTEVESGSFGIDVWDPERNYDPANQTLTTGQRPAPGRWLQCQVDGVPVGTFRTDMVGHDTAEQITTITCVDTVAEASHVPVQAYLPAGDTEDQLWTLVYAAGPPWGARLVLERALVSRRDAETFTGTLWEGLGRLVEAELGQLFIDGAGMIHVRGRGGLPDDTTPVLVMGDGGVPIVELGSQLDRRVTNTVLIAPINPASPALSYADAASVSAFGTAGLDVDAADLLLIP